MIKYLKRQHERSVLSRFVNLAKLYYVPRLS
jgi:hypothetical protein